jgi:hypothetical protein
MQEVSWVNVGQAPRILSNITFVTRQRRYGQM